MHITAVVPANAGTHNHRCSFYARLGPIASTTLLPVVMGPRGSLSSGGAERRPGGGTTPGKKSRAPLTFMKFLYLGAFPHLVFK